MEDWDYREFLEGLKYRLERIGVLRCGSMMLVSVSGLCGFA
jgi:hypothetical protein